MVTSGNDEIEQRLHERWMKRVRKMRGRHWRVRKLLYLYKFPLLATVAYVVFASTVFTVVPSPSSEFTFFVRIPTLGVFSAVVFFSTSIRIRSRSKEYGIGHPSTPLFVSKRTLRAISAQHGADPQQFRRRMGRTSTKHGFLRELNLTTRHTSGAFSSLPLFISLRTEQGRALLDTWVYRLLNHYWDGLASDVKKSNLGTTERERLTAVATANSTYFSNLSDQASERYRSLKVAAQQVEASFDDGALDALRAKSTPDQEGARERRAQELLYASEEFLNLRHRAKALTTDTTGN